MDDWEDNLVIRRALADCNVHEKHQTIDFRDAVFSLNGAIVQLMVDFMRRNVREMESLSLLFGYGDISDEAVDSLRAYIEDSMNLRKVRLSDESLRHEQYGRLLAGLLHGNPSIKELILDDFGLEGQDGGEILSALMLNNSTLEILDCIESFLDGIRGNRTLKKLALTRCKLGDEGVSVIVDAILEGNTTITFIGLGDNYITASGLPHLTRLLQHSKMTDIDLEDNPGLFADAENSTLFSSALSGTKLESLSLNFCKLPGHAVIALFQAVSNNDTLTTLAVYDNVQLQGQDLEHLLNTIPQIRYLQSLHVKLDFTNKDVLSTFHGNTSILHLYDENNEDEIEDDGPVFDILERNRRLHDAKQLLDCESFRRTEISSGGLWPKAIARLVRDTRGATAAYKILNEKLAMWCAPIIMPSAVAIASSAAAGGASLPTTSSNSTVKRSHTQHTSPGVDHHDEETQKRPRHHLSPNDKEPSTTAATATMMMMDNDTTSILDSLSTKELLEMIRQMKQKIAEQDAKIMAQADTIAMLLGKKSSTD